MLVVKIFCQALTFVAGAELMRISARRTCFYVKKNNQVCLRRIEDLPQGARLQSMMFSSKWCCDIRKHFSNKCSAGSCVATINMYTLAEHEALLQVMLRLVYASMRPGGDICNHVPTL